MKNTFGGWSVLGVATGLSALAGCSGPGDYVVDDSVPVAGTPPVAGTAPVPPPTGSTAAAFVFRGQTARASGKVAPIAGGTLLVTNDDYAVAADADRDAVHIVQLTDLTVRTVRLADGDEPGRVVAGPVGVAYVAARRGGVVLEVDLAEARARRIPVCSAPRGLAFDGAKNQLFVACRSGVLAVVDTTKRAVSERFRLDADLRDVVLSGDELIVTRFKSAEVLVVSRAGEVQRRAQPVASGRFAATTSSVAYRALGLPGGGVLVGHVNSSNVTLPSGAGAYYGSPCGGSVADMSVSLVKESTSDGNATLITSSAAVVGGAAGPIDLGLSPDGSRLAVISAGNAWDVNGTPPMNLWLSPLSQMGGSMFTSACGGGTTDRDVSTAQRVPGELVAVAFDSKNQWVAQSREPAKSSARERRRGLARDGLALRHRDGVVPYQHRRRHRVHVVPPRGGRRRAHLEFFSRPAPLAVAGRWREHPRPLPLGR